MFRRVLVANRAEIAVRIIRAIHECGAEAVAVYSDADRRSRHVRMADHAVRLGPADSLSSYLNSDAVIAAAKATDADAIHPGYGFLSERGMFARACAEAGIAFVGPSPETLDVTGDKVAARTLAQHAGVPLVPGTLHPIGGDASEGRVEADRIGYPLLIKATSGGGGKGMQIVRTPAEFPDAFARAQRVALTAFGDDHVYLERFVAQARHIEVQIFGDGCGDVIAIGDRDCSIQRRYQKVVEEAPAPNLSKHVRHRLHTDAIAIGRAANYGGAGTVEFLYDPSSHATYFLEVNARLQVEHPVTEVVHGIDLVHAQLAFASGMEMREACRRAGWRAGAAHGVAIEVRICAEDAEADWVPSTGTIGHLREPAGPGIRVDGWWEPGTVVGIDYDSLLAKVIAFGPDRDTAIRRLRRGLDECSVTGIVTTLPFHRWLVTQHSFLAGPVATSFISTHWRPSPAAPRVSAVGTAEPDAGEMDVGRSVEEVAAIAIARASIEQGRQVDPEVHHQNMASAWAVTARRESIGYRR